MNPNITLRFEIICKQHDDGTWVTTLEPTCTGTGTKELLCTICDYVLETDNITAHGHDIKWVITTQPEFPNTLGIETKGCTICEHTESETREYPILAIGATGPGGGRIFYVADGQEGRPTGFTVQGYGNPGDEGYFASYTAYYLEAAPENISGFQMWSSIWTDYIPGLSIAWNDETDRAIGRGRLNTAIIIARGKNHLPPYTTPAATVCAALTTGDQTDWFLPSRNELNELWLRRNDIDMPSSGGFWSSSQREFNYAYIHDFGDGYPDICHKDIRATVRPVRAF